MAMDTVTFGYPLTGAGTAYPLLKAPSGANGGGLSILEASLTNYATTSGTVGYGVSLVKYNAAGGTVLGTASAGTEGGTAASGTAAHWTALIPRSVGLGSGTASYLAPGEWLYAVITATNSGTPNACLSISYQRGR